MNKAIVIFVGYFLLITAGFATSAFASDCGPESYFSPSDDETPLRKPHSEFLKMRRLANAGDAMAQRNLAVSYENGYLVSQCAEKALYWYKKAASNDDVVAQSWMARHDQFERQMQQREYYIIQSGPSPTGNAPKVVAAEKEIAIAKQASNSAPKSASERSMQRYEDAERDYKICMATPHPAYHLCNRPLGDPDSGCWQTYGEDPTNENNWSKRSAQERYEACLAGQKARELYAK